MSENFQDLHFLTASRSSISPSSRRARPAPRCWPGSAPRWSRSRIPGAAIPGRRLRPGKPDDDPWYFHQFNVNKKSMAINLKSPRGLEIVKDMIKKADIMAENMAPGTIERLGLDYESVKKINPRIIYCQIKGFGERQPAREGPRLRHDRAGRRRPDQRHRRARPAAGQARPQLRRHRHRHADGGDDPRRAARAQPHRPGTPAAGGDAGRDDPLHAHLLCDDGAHRPARRRATAPSRAAATTRRPASTRAKGGGPNDYVYITTSRANPEHWSRLMKVDRARGADRRSALCHRRRPRRARKGARRDHRRMDPPARQARGDGEADRRRRAGRRGVRHDGIAERAELRGARHHADRASTTTATTRWRPGRCGSTARRCG